MKKNFHDSSVLGKNRFIIFTTVGIICFIIIITISTALYINSLRTQHDQITLRNVSNQNKRTALHLDDIFYIEYSMLESLAHSVSPYIENHADAADIERMLQWHRNRKPITYLALFSLDGDMICPLSPKINVKDEMFFKNIINGKKRVPEKFYMKNECVFSVAFAVPVKSFDGETIAVLVNFIEKSELENLFKYQQQLMSEDEQMLEFSYVIDISENEDIITPYYHSQVIDLLQGSKTLAEELSTLIGTSSENSGGKIESAKIGGEEYEIFSAYKKLAFSDWYVITFVPVKTREHKSIVLSRTFNILIVLVGIFLFALLAAEIYLRTYSSKSLKQAAIEDIVTHGGNARWFKIEAQKLINKFQEIEKDEMQKRALIIMNIDKFKLINDCYGRSEGDKTLRWIYGRITEILSPGEIAARIEGDKFCILVNYYSQKATKDRLELLMLNINSFNATRLSKFIITASFGVCTIEEYPCDYDSLHEKTELALKSAKQLHKGTKVAFYDENERKTILKEKEIENKMQNALHTKQFLVYFQPKYSLGNSKITGAEALARWRDTNGQMIMPNDFIPLFEQNGFIYQLDLCIFEQVCQLLRKWLDASLTPVIISVNLSRAYIRDMDFLPAFDNIRKRYNVPPNYIEFEITESVALDNTNRLIEIINSLHEKGYTCSLDDFGSGFSSLNVLKDIPIDVLKIDRKFFLDMENNEKRGNSVIESVIELAQKLKIKTVSEGVENETQIQFLKKAKCDMVQSFFYSRPLPVDEFEELLFDKNVAN